MDAPKTSRHSRVRSLPGLAVALVLGACGGGGPAAAPSRPIASAPAGPSECSDLASCRADCASGNGAACYSAGVMCETGTGGEQSYVEASQLYNQACRAGEVRACNNLGVLQEIGLVEPKNYEAAAELYKRACKAGEQEACINLALRYQEGVGAPKDPERARALLQAACGKGISLACRRLE